jgi:hypothetical protein
MLRYALAAVFCLGWLAQPGRGDPFQPIVNLPNAYIPGQPVAFNVRLPAISNLGAYNIDLVLESSVGNSGTDFYFDVTATTPASANYIFASHTNFFDAVTVDSPLRHRITLTDFAFSGVDVTGANDYVATVAFRTAPMFHNPLRIFVDSSQLILDTPSIPPASVQRFNVIQNDIAATGSAELVAVPEPSTLLITASTIGIVLFSVWRVRGGRAQGCNPD